MEGEARPDSSPWPYQHSPKLFSFRHVLRNSSRDRRKVFSEEFKWSSPFKQNDSAGDLKIEGRNDSVFYRPLLKTFRMPSNDKEVLIVLYTTFVY